MKASAPRLVAALLAATLFATLAAPAAAEVILDEDLAVAVRAAEAKRKQGIALAERSRGTRGTSLSTLQIGCDGPEAGRACRRASTHVEIGDIVRINRASGGTAIQETLIGTAR